MFPSYNLRVFTGVNQMRNNLLDEASAAEIIGVDRPTLYGWCKNFVINCTDAPKEYKDKTTFLISESECDYIASLITKFGVRKALLNYNKAWRNTSQIKADDIREESNEIPSVNPDKERSLDKDCEPEEKVVSPDRLVSSIVLSHALKGKINELRNELSKLEDEYAKLKDEIITQL